jgi:hypothetical protein
MTAAIAPKNQWGLVQLCDCRRLPEANFRDPNSYVFGQARNSPLCSYFSYLCPLHHPMFIVRPAFGHAEDRPNAMTITHLARETPVLFSHFVKSISLTSCSTRTSATDALTIDTKVGRSFGETQRCRRNLRGFSFRQQPVYFDLVLPRCCRVCTKARSTLFMRVW